MRLPGTASPLACQEFVELVTEYLEGTLPRRAHRQVERHLQACDGCRAYLQQMRVTIRTLGELPPEPADAHTRETLIAMFREVRGA